MQWRKKWEKNWAEVKYCSDACRRHKNDPMGEKLEAAILHLLAARGPGKTICPSEAARAVSPDNWRELMEPARRAARRLAQRGSIVITQAGKEIDAGNSLGPVRLKTKR